MPWSSKKRQVPKYSIASGFVIGDIPEELTQLNDMEARVVGLGICFTSCYNINGKCQECTKGHCINYWNDACTIAVSLPHPIERCGIVRLETARDPNHQRLFMVRPNLIRTALLWLREHNPLYKKLTYQMTCSRRSKKDKVANHRLH